MFSPEKDQSDEFSSSNIWKSLRYKNLSSSGKGQTQTFWTCFVRTDSYRLNVTQYLKKKKIKIDIYIFLNWNTEAN